MTSESLGVNNIKPIQPYSSAFFTLPISANLNSLNFLGFDKWNDLCLYIKTTSLCFAQTWKQNYSVTGVGFDYTEQIWKLGVINI